MVQTLKKQIVDEYKQDFNGMTSCLVVDYTGMSAPEMSTLRAGLKHDKVQVHVVQNRLATRAFGEVGLSQMEKLLDGPCAVVHGGSDAPTLCRSLRDWIRENKKMLIRGGLLDGVLLSEAEIESLADLPPLKVLHAQIAGAIAAPLMRMAGAFQAVYQQVGRALAEIQK